MSACNPALWPAIPPRAKALWILRNVRRRIGRWAPRRWTWTSEGPSTSLAARPAPRSLAAEPAGDVKLPKVRWRYPAQVGLHRPQALGSEDLGPAGAQVVEDACREFQRVDGAAGQPRDLAPCVGRVRPALQVAELLERVDGLARGLLRYA